MILGRPGRAVAYRVRRVVRLIHDDGRELTQVVGFFEAADRLRRRRHDDRRVGGSQFEGPLPGGVMRRDGEGFHAPLLELFRRLPDDGQLVVQEEDAPIILAGPSSGDCCLARPCRKLHHHGAGTVVKARLDVG